VSPAGATAGRATAAAGPAWRSAAVTAPGNGPRAAHTKYSSYDDQVVIVGTTNMDTASWNFSHELNLAIDDADTTADMDRRLFDADWERAIVVDECK